MKKYFIMAVLFFVLFPVTIFASTTITARIGDKYFDSLSDAIEYARSEDTIVMLANETLDNTLVINKEININLNGYNISAPSTVFLVKGGALNVSGKGIIKEIKPNNGAIKVIGSATFTDEKYSLVNIEKDVTLEGWSGIFITHDNGKSYGVAVYIDGKINAVSDIDGGTGIGIYVNGNIKEESSPIINIFDNAEIHSNGNGLYIAGYSNIFINKAYIEGDESGIGIKSGKLNIDGATIVSNGRDATPTEGYNNGIKASGTALQIESNNGYAGNIEINISDGKFTSKNSNVIYEYIGKGSITQVKSISISGGTFLSESDKNVFLLSSSLKNTHPRFISGGDYSSNPEQYLKSGYSTILNNNLYKVTQNTMKEVFSEQTHTSNIFMCILLIVFILLIIILTYLNRTKIIKVIKKYKR